ncbi:MAG: PQQ-binding-like beta-propeller repeat protein, partial [Planctomycetota bacterium]|nr:PQQ-binding-like beta-propeller repeat protein [Planctomycetota bacterium]
SFPLELGRDEKNNPLPVTVALVSDKRIYGYSDQFIFALDPASDASPNPKVRPKLVWQHPVKGTPSSMMVADGKLFVTTKQGDLHCFAGPQSVAHDWARPPRTLPEPTDRSANVQDMLADAHTTQGFCLVLGLQDGRSVHELLRQSKMRILVIDKDPVRINTLRNQMTDLGFYGNRVEAYVGDILTMKLPPYLANLVISEDWSRTGLSRGQPLVNQIYAAIRPYGGTACFEIANDDQTKLQVWAKDLPRAEIRKLNQFVSVSRVGKLPGAGDWTDEYGNPANTLMSSDQRVKAPFGVLWFGGPSAHPDLYYDRHLWASSAIIIHGRMFIQGPQKLTAVDVYTGRILWQIPLKKGLSPGRRATWGSTGFHFLATADRVYLTYEKVCRVLDAATGNQTTEIKLPDPDYGIGRIRIWNDLLIVPSFTNHKDFGPVPTRISAINRFDGKQVWKVDTPLSFPLIALGKEKLFVFEGLLAQLYENSKRKGKVPKSAPEKFLGAFDLKTGQRLWKQPTQRVVTWLAYSQTQDTLIASDKTGIESWRGSAGKMLWTKNATGVGFKGHPENLWDKVILWNDRIIDQRGPGKSYDLETGQSNLNLHPITEQPFDWQFTKVGHHCNYAVASEHLMTFRAKSAGYLDMNSGGTSRLQGFRSGCRNSLIPANGVL